MADMRQMGRYQIGGFARSTDGTVYEVIGFITSPAVVLREVKTGGKRYEVIGCRNEESDLTAYTEEPLRA